MTTKHDCKAAAAIPINTWRTHEKDLELRWLTLTWVMQKIASASSARMTKTGIGWWQSGAALMRRRLVRMGRGAENTGGRERAVATHPLFCC